MEYWDDYDSMAEKMAGNWRKFEAFAWHARPDDDPYDWMIWNTHHRDSDQLDRSNAAIIDREFEHFFDCDSPYIRYEYANHWLVGWMSGFSIKVHDKRGRITNAFKRFCDIQASLEDYPLLDEEHYSELQYNEAIEVLGDWPFSSMVSDDAPEYWKSEVLSDLMDLGEDLHEFYPSENVVREILEWREWLDRE